MYAKIPDNTSKLDVEKMMATVFPGSNMKWSSISNVKIIAGKYKGARKSTTFIQPVGSGKITLLYLECPDGKKVLNWVTFYEEVFIILSFALVLSFLSFLFLIKLFPVMITITALIGLSLLFLKKDKKKVDDKILNGLDKYKKRF
jgi:hypothetical protein